MKWSLCSESDRLWALRYIREARVDLSLTEDLKTQETITELVTMALKKAQLAIQYAMGQSDYLDFALAQAALGKIESVDPPIRMLMKIKEITKNLLEAQNLIKKEIVLETAEIIIDTAEFVVKEFTD